jgi:hypothetical protein
MEVVESLQRHRLKRLCEKWRIAQISFRKGFDLLSAKIKSAYNAIVALSL